MAAAGSHLPSLPLFAMTVSLAAVILAIAATPVFAGHFGGVEEWSIYPSFQYFNWREYKSTGAKILTEEGLLVGAGGSARLDLYDRKLMLKTKGELFGGDVGYNGHTQQLPPLPSPPNPPNTPDPDSERPVKTDVVYFGVKAETDLGWRIPIPHGSVEPFAGLGYRWWLRSLQGASSTDANGGAISVGGYPEYWQSLYTRLGARAAWLYSDGLTVFAEAGGKYPLYNQNLADFPGTDKVAIRPGKAWTAFAEIGAAHKRFRPSIFYEGFSFPRSTTVRAFSTIENRVIEVSQPRSASDIFGLNLAWLF
jgi:hypothetical protein